MVLNALLVLKAELVRLEETRVPDVLVGQVKLSWSVVLLLVMMVLTLLLVLKAELVRLEETKVRGVLVALVMMWKVMMV